MVRSRPRRHTSATGAQTWKVTGSFRCSRRGKCPALMGCIVCSWRSENTMATLVSTNMYWLSRTWAVDCRAAASATWASSRTAALLAAGRAGEARAARKGGPDGLGKPDFCDQVFLQPVQVPGWHVAG